MWYSVIITCEARVVEAVEYALMEAGAVGVEELPAGVSGAFEGEPERGRVDEALAEALRIYEIEPAAVHGIEVRQVEERDWLAEWKAGWQPIEVGARFLVAPPWSEVHESERLVIRIEPGMAFGTGTHETTRLCLQAMETHFHGDSFLDVGTGTGILAIAAAKFAPHARVEACDTDADAVAIAQENARLNHVGERIDFWTGTLDEATASASCVCANLTADVILPLLPTLVGATCESLILSGILASQVSAVTARLRELGVHQHHITADGEWVAISC